MRILRQSAPDSEDSAHTGPFCLHPLRACCTLHMRGCVRVPQVVCASLALHTLYLLTVLYLEFHQRKKRWRQSLNHGMLMVRPGHFLYAWGAWRLSGSPGCTTEL